LVLEAFQQVGDPIGYCMLDSFGRTDGGGMGEDGGRWVGGSARPGMERRLA